MNELMGIKEAAVMLLSVAIYNKVIDEDTAMDVLLSMDKSASGSDLELDNRAKTISPIIKSLTDRYNEAQHDKI
ncbi:MAG TPA: hypothetical protein VN081_04435 [Dongiaceae bacterium]|nr:hypothetical protein [Dongiaceae bacterium]